ncbi:hypothetical protein ABEB36_001006 [Hypothenemus hampei]|uniref:C2H2-type domain-containing protein n=1 Tax=Hypothenemus hampei TaxID=57062 RepID=A0ABD1FD52_HYPHA
MNRRNGGNPRGGNRGPLHSNFSQQQPFQSGIANLNPWQASATTSNQTGLLSHLTSAPHLALALSNLLQQQQQQQQPPSLLSLNTTSPAFSNSNSNYGGGANNRFNSHRSVRDFRHNRHEPYNKSRGSGGFQDRRRRSPKRDGRSRDEGNKKKTVEKKKNETEQTNNKAKEGAAEQQPPSSQSVEDGGEEDKNETKRDWKDEKNQVEGVENEHDDADDNEDEKNTASTSGEKKDGDNAKEGKYWGVEKRYLHCFVCNKQMWDGESMGKHVRGRAHHEMVKALEESIHICVNILRENLRLQEERKMIEYNRQSRQRKFNSRREPPLSHCAMCDLKFMGKIISHRRTEGHQRLKRYLHPTCRICDKEYPSRIEWIEHCLTPEHLRRASETTEKRIGGKDGDEIITNEQDMNDVDMDAALDENLHLESDDPILELDSSLANMVDRLPVYKKDRPVATSCLEQFSGWKCSLCHRSFADKDDADAHLKTKRHYYRFIEYIKERFDREEKRKKAEKEEALEKKKIEEKQEEEEEAKEELNQGEIII